MILADFVRDRVHEVLVISYEMLRQHVAVLMELPLGVVICDEGHRLRNPNNKTTKALLSLNTSRRILVSGTPFQNNLQEFYTLVNFINPGALGTPETFRYTYERPILQSRDPHAGSVIQQLAEERIAELARVTQTFILRRTIEVLEAYLPVKTEQIVFCAPSPLQRTLYRQYLRSTQVARVLHEGLFSVNAFVSITILKKIVNHPWLLWHSLLSSSSKLKPISSVSTPFNQQEVQLNDDDDDDDDDDNNNSNNNNNNNNCSRGQIKDTDNSEVLWSETMEEKIFDEALFPLEYRQESTTVSNNYWPSHSGKLAVLNELLRLCQQVRDKVVVASHYTQTLDLLERLCRACGYYYLRLDGSTEASLRHNLVQRFQTEPNICISLSLSLSLSLNVSVLLRTSTCL
jgi:SNF2 family DNA or RNA helicase